MKTVAVLYSGGKDSNLALHRALDAGLKVKYLITIMPAGADAWMLHWPNAKWTELQAKALGIEHLTAKTEVGEEKEVAVIEEMLRKVSKDVDTIAAGALASRYQYDRIGGLCKKLGLEVFAPLWQSNPADLWQELLDLGFEIIMISVSADGLGKEWLGRRIDQKAFEELKATSERFKFHLGGEGGEFETFVLNSPDFKKRIEILDSTVSWDKKTKTGSFLIKKARLA